MAKRAVVIGGTGLVGAHLIDLLSDSEYFDSVISLTRRPSEHTSNKVENHVVDFTKLENHAELFQGDVFYSCLGTTLKQAGSISAQRVVDFDYQYQAAKIAINKGIQHYVLVSSSRANSTSMSSYLKMKGELEEAVINLGFFHVSILQPSLLLGDRASRRTVEGIGALIAPILCKLPGLTRYKPIHGRQVAQKMLDLSISSKSKLEYFELDQVFPTSSPD